jgi:hypothetical protein
MIPGLTKYHEEYVQNLFSYYGVKEGLSTIFFKSSSEAVVAGLRIANRSTSRLGVIRCGFTG